VNLTLTESISAEKQPIKKLPDFREVRGFFRFTPQKMDTFCNRHALFPNPGQRKKVCEFFLSENREPLYFELALLDGFWKLDCAGETERIGRLGLASDNPQTYAALDLYHQLRDEAEDDRPMCLEDVRTVYTRCYHKRESGDSRKKAKEEESQPSFVINKFNSLSERHNVPLGYHIEKNTPKKALHRLVLLRPRSDITKPEIAPFSMLNELNSFAATAICERGLLKALTEIGVGCKLKDPPQEIYDVLLRCDNTAVAAALSRGARAKMAGVIDKYGYGTVELGKVIGLPDMIIEREGLRVFDVTIPFLLGYTMYDDAMMRDVPGLPAYTGPKRLTRRAIIAAFTDCCTKEKDIDLSHVGKIVFAPYGGKYRLTPSQVFATLNADGKAFLTATHTCEGKIESAFLEGVYSVVVAVGKLVAAGVTPNHIRVDCNLPYVEAGKDKGREFIYRLGILYARSAVFAGVFANDPNEAGNNTKNVVAGGVALPQQLISNLYRGGRKVFRLPLKRDSYGMPDFKYLKKLLSAVSINIANKNIMQASVAEQNALCEIVKSCLGENCGFSFANSDTGILKPCFGDLIVSIEDIFGLAGIESEYLGIADGSGIIKGAEIEIKLSELYKCGEAEHFRGQNAVSADLKAGHPAHIYSGQKNYTPVVYLPVFDKSSGLIEKSFVDCGAKVDAHLLAPADREFFVEIRKRIERSDILVFSSSPNKHADMKKIITEFCSHAIVMDAIHELLYRREGLILAFGEAFYSLVELGFLPYGRFVENTASSFTIKRCGEALSTGKIARAKLTSVSSPWLSSCSAGATFAAVSPGRGCSLTVEDAALASLKQGAQICSQYINPADQPAFGIPYNPACNTAAIESLCSPDGRIYGAIGHNYKVASLVNAGENMDLNLFKNGINYFR